MQAIIKGLEKVKQELTASENDGPVSEVFRKVCSLFVKCLFLVFFLLSIHVLMTCLCINNLGKYKYMGEI